MVALIASHPALRLILLAGLFAGVFLLVGRAINKSAARSAVRRELQVIARGGVAAANRHSLHQRRDDVLTRMIEGIEQAGLNLADSKSDVLRAKMIAAGYSAPTAPRFYTLVRLLLVVGLPVLVVGISLLTGHKLTFFKLYQYGSMAALAGFYVPSMVLRAKTDHRRAALLNGFPDCLDLMLVCVEAGLGMEAALDRVGRELALSHPLVANLLTTTTLQLRAGASREMALRRSPASTRSARSWRCWCSRTSWVPAWPRPCVFTRPKCATSAGCAPRRRRTASPFSSRSRWWFACCR